MAYTAYVKQNWNSGSAGNTPITATRLNYIETGIYNVGQEAIALNTRLNTVESSVTSLSGSIGTQSGLITGLRTDVNTLLAGGGGGSGGAVSSVAGRTGAIVLTKTDVGLGNVDNTTDLAKPLSTATTNALALKAPLASPTFTGTVSGITKTMVGLGNVDNTSDANKPLSTAETAALALKAPLASPTFTGTVSGITKTMVGLGNVDNTSDLTKFTTWAVRPVLEHNGTTWPSRTVPSGYTGKVLWSSLGVANVSAPAGALDGDIWERRVTAA